MQLPLSPVVCCQPLFVPAAAGDCGPGPFWSMGLCAVARSLTMLAGLACNRLFSALSAVKTTAITALTSCCR